MSTYSHHATRLRYRILVAALAFFPVSGNGQNETANARKHLAGLQQEFVNLRFGMFICYNMSSYLNHDWADPHADPSLLNPKNLDCDQWAKAAKSANMSFGCFTAKHASGFAMWDTKTTDYKVTNGPLKRDVVKEFVNAFRANNLKVMLYYSILDLHHDLRPNSINRQHVKLVKQQLTELLTNYGKITAIFFDSWDSPWSRISYDEIPFEQIYSLVKSIQPDCLVMDLNASKYPPDALYYTDIKSYEQNAGEHISKETNKLPAASSFPLNETWFWKKTFPAEPVKNPAALVNNNIIPLNNVFCNFILSVAPNPDGLIDSNALAALKEIGRLWKNNGPLPGLSPCEYPVISSNLAKKQVSNSSWSDDMWISDFANDDNFSTAWISNPVVKNPWYEIQFHKDKKFNTIIIAEENPNLKKYRLQYYNGGEWKTILQGNRSERIKIHRFRAVTSRRVRVLLDTYNTPPHITEFEIYNEKR
jgi:alpha-L-fucosidase